MCVGERWHTLRVTLLHASLSLPADLTRSPHSDAILGDWPSRYKKMKCKIKGSATRCVDGTRNSEVAHSAELSARFIMLEVGNRAYKNPHLIFKIISNDFCQIGLVGRKIVWLIHRRPEGVRAWDLHHKNRRTALFPNICVRRPKILNF